ncbi:hypothetical protein [Microbulbifer spongiae]|uniref:Apea-like HEPN domain-containing protein n=1 Tax=Microbulbifer spongiae TaxID=2944933 RepID=A0ABY9EH62_9GAMM|nr:hypothetical protein [Microbulbifer sp. MI-G]WKD51124.1 hypothetical protein M8T91_06815 [Microbulbifer sp. MI-G]
MQNLPSHLFKEIQEAICRPEGTVTFNYESPDLFDKDKLGEVILEIPSGQHLFRLERDNSLCVHFYHSSPGTGTRVATVDLKNLPPAPVVFLAFSWTPSETKLHVRPNTPEAELVSATGVVSQRQFCVGKDGRVYQIGDNGLDVMGLNSYQAGEPIILPTGKKAWEETVKAIEVLSKGESKESYIFEVVVTNLSLAILVTGFETYSKKRFLELEQEGLTPNTNSVIDAFYSKKEREIGIGTVLESEAEDAGTTVLQHVVSKGKINFQNYSSCKRAFKKAYGIKFGNLGLSSDTLENLQSFIRYRHRIIHVSSLDGTLNLENIPPEEPIFSNKETAENATNCFSEFIEALHKSTLSLRPGNKP